MGRKNKDIQLGRSLIKRTNVRQRKAGSSLLHTAELDDGQDWNRINFKSVTEETDIESFLSTAELAGTEFTAQKLNIRFVHPSQQGIVSQEERNRIKQLHKENEKQLRIPRRPSWDRSMSAEELAAAEREGFLNWRRGLATLAEEKNLTMTPFEKNLEFWRQLWRVIERSDIVVQIVDARNPLLFRCVDLELYVKELNPAKENLLLVNKSDFLTEEQRMKWGEYFKAVGLKAVFFSATAGNLNLQTVPEEPESSADAEGSDEVEDPDNREKLENFTESTQSLEEAIEECKKDIEQFSLQEKLNECGSQNHVDTSSTDQKDPFPSLRAPDCPDSASMPVVGSASGGMSQAAGDPSSWINSSLLLNREQLVEFFRSFNTNRVILPGLPKYITIGLVGYPNVGKSSTINTLLQQKKVSVSATPGKTKHFQTLPLTEDVMLCDCPGLVFPAFVTTKEEMIVWGILPIDQMKDHVPPMNLILSWFPRCILEATYGISLPRPQEGEDPDRCSTSEEFLNAYGWMRGFMTQRGMPDQPRSSRYILKDFVNGALLFCLAPPDILQEHFHKFRINKACRLNVVRGREGPSKPSLSDTRKAEEVDRAFFSRTTVAFGIKGRRIQNQAGLVGMFCENFQGKLPKAKPKRNIKEKLRRKYAYLDQ